MKLIQRKWKLTVAMVCAAVLVVTVAYAATAGGQGDPLITLSYLEQVFQPQVEDTVEQAVTAQRQQLQQRLEQAISGWNAQVQEAIAGLEAGESALFQAVSLGQGQSLVGQAGCEVVVRAGTAQCQDRGLIDASCIWWEEAPARSRPPQTRSSCWCEGRTRSWSEGGVHKSFIKCLQIGKHFPSGSC